MMERFKSLTTKRYIEGVRVHGWYSFSGKLWQRSYHDRIIRNATELNKIRTYICNGFKCQNVQMRSDHEISLFLKGLM